MSFRRFELTEPQPSWPERFGMRSREQVVRDVSLVLHHLPRGDRYIFSVESLGLLRPDLSLPVHAGLYPASGTAPIFNFFDRTAGGREYRVTVSRRRMRDWRGGRLSYDEHDGTDFVCPPGTPLAAAAPGVAVVLRDRWLRGGLTLCIDHGCGVVTQYSHLTRALVEPGRPVRRGETVALAGQSGFDMTQFFPWVPPHVHFMVWVHGRPIDPFLAAGETRVAGTWAHGNVPRTAPGPLAGDGAAPALAAVAVDRAAVDAVLRLCRGPEIRREMEAAPSDAARVALLEDSLHHDRPAWPDEARTIPLRPPQDAARVRLTLPLTSEMYRDAAPADAPWTHP